MVTKQDWARGSRGFAGDWWPVRAVPWGFHVQQDSQCAHWPLCLVAFFRSKAVTAVFQGRALASWARGPLRDKHGPERHLGGLWRCSRRASLRPELQAPLDGTSGHRPRGPVLESLYTWP